jgi:hypothetical protein
LNAIGTEFGSLKILFRFRVVKITTEVIDEHYGQVVVILVVEDVLVEDL